MSETLKVLVAAHKPYWMPYDPAYLPVHVGARGKEPIPGLRSDDDGDSISALNPYFCELTGVYWAWKNIDAAYVGSAHYRRYFADRRFGDKKTRIASGEALSRILDEYPVILPVERNYFIETNRSQYDHAHHAIDLDMTREILVERHPEYVEAFDASMNRTHGHRFNMFVMRRDIFDEYCEWLFDVLFELQRRLDISSYSPNDQRVFGFVSERLLDPWIETRGIAYAEMPVVNLESQHWGRKIVSFLLRKLGHR